MKKVCQFTVKANDPDVLSLRITSRDIMKVICQLSRDGLESPIDNYITVINLSGTLHTTRAFEG